MFDECSAAADRQNVPVKTKAYLVFEGGGAKGIAHVGVGNAIEATEYFDPLGYAGTSAGAIVACLLSVGYAPSKVFDIRAALERKSFANEGISNIFDHLPPWYEADTPVGLFSKPDWVKLRTVRRLVGLPKWIVILGLLVLGAVLFPTWLCCTNHAGDSLSESSMVAGRHEQLGSDKVQDQELAFV